MDEAGGRPEMSIGVLRDWALRGLVPENPHLVDEIVNFLDLVWLEHMGNRLGAAHSGNRVVYAFATALSYPVPSMDLSGTALRLMEFVNCNRARDVQIPKNTPIAVSLWIRGLNNNDARRDFQTHPPRIITEFIRAVTVAIDYGRVEDATVGAIAGVVRDRPAWSTIVLGVKKVYLRACRAALDLHRLDFDDD